ncbi:MAG: hypothetical protein RI922_2589 [Bacteroidota bacterium]|jgi:hypothetical protein
MKVKRNSKLRLLNYGLILIGLSSMKTICAQVVVSNGTSIVANNNAIIVLQDISYNNESSNAHFIDPLNNCSVKLTGTNPVSFNSSASYITEFSNLLIDKVNSSVTLNNPLNVKSVLTMLNGDVYSSSTNTLTLGVNSPGLINYFAGTVIGPMKRWFNATTNSGQSASLFPVGNNSSGVKNRKALLEFTSSPTQAGYVSIEFIGQNPTLTSAGTNGITLVDQYNWQLDNVSTEGFWDVKQLNSVGGTYSLIARANQFTTLDYSASRIIKSATPNTTWSLEGLHGTTVGNQLDYTINRTGLTGTAYYAIAYPTAIPLPIELISFQANCNDDNSVSITWSTATEFNCASYIIEKSRDGLNWNVLATVPGSGNSTSLLSYTYLDENAESGTNYYRLIQFDMDGASHTFNIDSSNCNESNSGNPIVIYPNPSLNEFYIDFYSTTLNKESFISIVDAKGAQVLFKRILIETGSNVVHLENLNLARGIYFVQITDGTNATEIVKYCNN